jgi:transposase InsO family protein
MWSTGPKIEPLKEPFELLQIDLVRNRLRVHPQHNAYVERFNRTVRYEWLSQYPWRDLDEVRDFATDWIWKYNHERPHMALGGITPMQRLAMAA